MDTTQQHSLEQFICPIEVTMKRIGGKWKCTVLWWLRQYPKSFGELRRLMPGISAKVLTQQLRELEHDGFICRETHHEVPRRVDYALTPSGETLIPITDLMCEWGKTQLPGFRFGLLNLTNLRILIISHEASFREWLHSELTFRGASVIALASIAEGVIAVQQKQPHALVIDTEMSDDHTYELMRQLSKLTSASGRQLPAIALSSPARAAERKQALQANVRVCLVKPVEITELVASLASLTGLLISKNS